MFSNFFSSALSVNIGQIVLANPFLNFYQLRPGLSVSSVPEIIDATAIGSLAGRTGGVSVQETFQIGDTVLYVWKRDSMNDSGLNQAIILGKCSPTYTFNPVSLNAMLGSGVTLVNGQLYDIHETQLQRVNWSHDNNSTSFIDFFGGDWAVHGQQSGILVSDLYVGTRAGQSSFILDALNRSIIESSLLRSVYTVGGEETVSLYNNQIVYAKKYSGHTEDTYAKRVEEIDLQIDAVSSTPNYKYQTMISDAIYGREENVLGSPMVIYGSDQFRQDGIRILSSRLGISLERDPALTRWQYVGKRIETDGNSDTGSLQDPGSGLMGRQTWTQAFGGASSYKYTQADFTEPAAYPEKMQDVINDRYGMRKTNPSGAHIRLLPSGGISIMDAWGSQILMEGGNIQISAANNLIRLTGRDEIGLIQGVSTTNAKHVQIAAATGTAAIFGKVGANIGSDGTTTVEGRSLYTYGRSEAVHTAPLHQILSKATDYAAPGGVQIYSEDAPVTVLSKALTMRGENGGVLSAGSCAVTLAGSSAVIGARAIQMTGSLLLKAESFTIDVPQATSAESKTITIDSGVTMLQVEGHVIVDKMMKINDSVVVVDTLCAKILAAHERTQLGGVYKCNENEKTNIKEGFAKKIGAFTESVSKIVGKFYEKIKNDILTQNRFGFRIKSENAVAINEPKFSANTDNIEGFSVAVTVDGEGEQTYIYPGKRFWTKDGMYKYVERGVVTDKTDVYPDKSTMAVTKLVLSETKHIKSNKESE